MSVVAFYRVVSFLPVLVNLDHRRMRNTGQMIVTSLETPELTLYVMA